MGATARQAVAAIAASSVSRCDCPPDEFFEGKVVMRAQLLGLLVAFIGEK
jgi:hypothetical protein